MGEQADSATLAVFLIGDEAGAKRFLAEIERIDSTDTNVQIVDAAIAQRTRLGRVKVHQTTQRRAVKGATKGGVLGVVIGAILLGPIGPVVGGVLGGTFGGLRGRLRDIGIDDKLMKAASDGIARGQAVLFVQYEGDWAASIGAIQDLVRAEQALLIDSTLSAEKSEALEALVAPVVEELGGEEAVSDYEVDVEAAESEAAEAVADDLTRIEGLDAEAAEALTAAGVASYAQLASTSEPDARRIISAAGLATPDDIDTWAMQASFAAHGDWPGLDAYLRASQPEAETAPEAAPSGGRDDLTQLSGIGPRVAEALAAAGITTYASLAQVNEPQLRHALHASDMTPPAGVGSWPMQASYAARGDWQGLMRYNQKRSGATQSRSTAPAAPTAPASPPDDLTQIKGIGPRVAAALADANVTTYAQLERVDTAQLRSVLASRGILPPGALDSWAAQAAYAGRGDWEGLAAYNRR
jgi:predicted flap endonuclease-1-like 5' DNA nuclease